MPQLNDWALLFLANEQIVRRTAWERSLDPESPEEDSLQTLTLYESADGFIFEEFIQEKLLPDGTPLFALALRVTEGPPITETLWNIEQLAVRLDEDERLLSLVSSGATAEEVRAFEELLEEERRERVASTARN